MTGFPFALQPARKTSTGNAMQKIAITGSGVATALLLNDASKRPRRVKLTATAPCLVRFPVSSSTAVSTSVADFYFVAGGEYMVQIPSDALYIDILAEPNTGSGAIYLNVLDWSV